ncbi:MAG: FtsW/RodA/SpoVE family cell cycle protein [Eubacteriaceae bacterium]|nr:FtsW/RodA/SpoVE family cell cycle protein [Eubacteriaceae bacterium]
MIRQTIRKAIIAIPSQRSRRADRGILITVVVLCVFGLFMIWSASMYNAKTDPSLHYDEFYYVKKQLLFFLAGGAVMMFLSVMNIEILKSLSPWLMGLMLVLLLLTASGSSGEVNGAVRAIKIGSLVIMPAEFTKIAVLCFTAYFCELTLSHIKKLDMFAIILALTAVTFYVIYRQPALTTAAIIAIVIMGMYFVAGGNLVYLFLSAAGAAALVYKKFIGGSDWRMDRINAWSDPFTNILDEGWQPANSIMALGSGGLTGRGVAKSIAKLSFLPEPQNDYIFSIIGEEFGFLGCILLMAVYLFLIARLFILAFNSKSTFAKLFCAGSGILFALQVFLNIGVCTNLLPSTGVSLPFISSGGSSLISFMAVIGIVLNISRNNPIPRFGPVWRDFVDQFTN